MILLHSIATLYRLLTPASRRAAWGLLALASLNSLIELAGIACTGPMLLVFSQPQKSLTTPWALWLHPASSRELLVMVTGIFLAVFGLGRIVNVVAAWASYRFSFTVSYELETSMLERYLRRPYSWFLTQNTGGLAKDVLGEVEQLVQQLVLRLVVLVRDMFLALSIIILLLCLNPVGACLIGLALGATYRVAFHTLRLRLTRIGKQRGEVVKTRFKDVLEALSALKEGRMVLRGQDFHERFARSSRRFNDIQAKYRVLVELPHYVVEMVAISSILGVFLYLALTRASNPLPSMVVFIMATWRMAPALSSAYRSASTARFYRPLLDRLAEELSHPSQADSGATMTMERGLRLEQVTFSYPAGEGVCLQAIDLELPRGSSLALVGPTGGGKTTVAEIMAGLLRPDTGRVLVDEQPLEPDQAKAWQRNVGYVPQEIYLTDASILRNIALGLPESEISRERVESAARAARIHDFIHGLEAGYDTVIGERGVNLSGGQRQRLGIARALYHDPEVLILDEATNALDVDTEQAVMESINSLRGSKTLVIIAHRLSTVRDCDVVYQIEGGSSRLSELACSP